MAAATATFNDSTGGVIGMVTRASQAATTAADNPGPSPPNSSATGPCHGTESGSAPPRATAAIVRTPALARHATAASTGIDATVGTRSALPMLPRSALHENGLADAPLASAPVIPAASPAR